MDISIHTSDPDNVDPAAVKNALEEANFFVLSVNVNDGERVWNFSPEPTQPSTPVPDLEMTVTGSYEGNSSPAPVEYLVSLTVLGTGEDFGLVVRPTAGTVVDPDTLDVAAAEGVIRMASTDHGLSGYEDDWTIPRGMDRALTWNVGSGHDVVMLTEGQINEVAQWLRFATGEDTWDWAEHGKDWSY